MDDPGMKPVKIFKQPDARTTMNIRNKKFHPRHPVIRKIKDFLLYLFVIKEIIPLPKSGRNIFQAGMIRQFIIFTGVTVMENLIYRLAA